MGMSTGGGGYNKGRGSGYRPMAEINVTPMVDVMLVLLIIFMVAAPLLTASLYRPSRPQKPRPLAMRTTSLGSVHLQGWSHICWRNVVTEERIITILTSGMTEDNPDRRIYIRADKSLDYGKVMRILGNINGAGFNKVALISESVLKNRQQSFAKV